MTGSFGEIKAVLAEVSTCLGAAYRGAVSARAGIAEAVALLAELDRVHPDGLVPPELSRAEAELALVLGFISGGADSVAALDARL